MIVKKFQHVFGTLTGFDEGAPPVEISTRTGARPVRKITFLDIRKKFRCNCGDF